MSVPVYLDYNATTPLEPRVIETINSYLREHFGNPSSSHYFGRSAAEGIAWARHQVARLIDAGEDDIVFTGSATEANNMAVLGLAGSVAEGGGHLVTSAIEHPSVRQPFEHLREQGWQLSIVPVDQYGRVDPADVAKAMRPETALVSVMHANNETGTIQPIREISEIVKRHNSVLHVDASQSVGKIPVSVKKLGADMLTLAGHKFYAPKGVAALYVRKGIRLSPLMFGADQEYGRRTGTENVAYVAGLGMAARIARQRQDTESIRLCYKRDRLYQLLARKIPRLAINGHPEWILPNTLNVSFPDVNGQALLDKVASEVAASTGSACHAGDKEAGPVLQAMGLSAARIDGAVRLSVGVPTTEVEIEFAAAMLIEAWQSSTTENDMAAGG